ncbi:MAG: hypothetical protein DMF84_30935 [Acidobacteria bacterium]|nr:MAG: hypothetical protein DMF84_30935 [Acidobacteriota bacterium]TMM25184.1 MAG: hypothetical protein E6F94_08520 [Actinomycetota bacterium]
MNSPPGRRFAFRPELVLDVQGSRSALAHFAAEYGAAEVTGARGDPSVCVRFDSGEPQSEVGVVDGRYKTVRWRVFLSSPDAPVLTASINISGHPTSFGLSLLQGFFVEPLLALAAMRARYVLLPAAAVELDGKALLVIGRSRSGKSSVCARALAAGRRVLGDDHVIVDERATIFPFPRRLRLYSDLPVTAPGAYRSLARTQRRALLARKLARRVTRGYVAPPLRVQPTDLGGPPAEPLELERILVIEPGDATDVAYSELDLDSLVPLALQVLQEQRTALAATNEDWRQASKAASADEARLLRAAFVETRAQRIAIPRGFDAARAVDTISAWIGIGR